MKKIIILVGIILTSFSACSDFIEEENLSSVTAESFYVTAEGFQALVNTNYAELRNIYGDDPWLFCAGTDLYAKGRNDEPEGLSKYTDLIASSEGVDHLYNTCFKSIQISNRALYYAAITEQTSELSKLVGEVKFLRANAYFLLVQTYGGVSIVPYIDSPEIAFDRNSAEEVYSQIITDLEEAYASVGAGAFGGKVNKRAVQNLLAKVYLTRGYESFGSDADFIKAAELADAVIAGQSLNLTYNELWNPANEMNEEIIFSVQIDEGSVSADPTNLGSKQFYFFGSYLGGSEVSGSAPYRSYNLCPNDFAIGLFEKGDARWEGTFMTEVFETYYDYFRVANHNSLTVKHFYEPKWFTAADKLAYQAIHNLPEKQYHNYGEYSAEYAEIEAFDYETICIKKFDDPKTSTPFGNGRVSTRDIVLARLGETYLIAAEAYVHSNTAKAAERVNEVRRRAGASAVTAGAMTIDFILDERARELMGEYHRWFDLKRTGKLVERASKYNHLISAANFNGANGVQKILRPIPQSALDLNQNRNFPQNPAYN
jgi:hypothetical protein